jgi:hypothetical protein
MWCAEGFLLLLPDSSSEQIDTLSGCVSASNKRQTAIPSMRYINH